MNTTRKGDILELMPKKDRDETVLGVFLGFFGLLLLAAAPFVLHQTWSYRFGAISFGYRMSLAVLAVFLGLFSLAGAGYNIVKRSIYRFDLSTGTFAFGEYLIKPGKLRSSRIADLAGVAIVKKLVSPGSERFWVGVPLPSGETVYIDEFFPDRKSAEQLRVAITSATGLSEV